VSPWAWGAGRRQRLVVACGFCTTHLYSVTVHVAPQSPGASGFAAARLCTKDRLYYRV